MSTREERKGKRGHDDQGNVRPADDRYGLHEPEEESVYVRTEITPDNPPAPTEQTTTPRKAKR